ncbi:nitroreductase family protein [Gammaproteobacteria bacterium]|nr:nitroreductase family protein [Gammaproteobacteria bacterium]
MDALDNILNRVSSRELSLPHPSTEEMALVYKAALRAPDHAWLRPSSFIEVKGDGLNKLSKVFEDYALTIANIEEFRVNKYKEAPFRAPMIVVLVNTFTEHPKVPAIEQKLSTAAAAQNIMLCLNAQGYGAIWRTGKLAFNETISKNLGLNPNQEILGFLYIGTNSGKNKKIPDLDIDNFVTVL